MSKAALISHEDVIAALITHGTQKEAAAALGVSERTLFDRMQDGEFKAQYKSTKADILRAAAFNVSSKLNEAVEVIADIMNDKAVSPSTRLQAAQTIIKNSGVMAAQLSDSEKAVTGQLRLNEEAERSSLFDFFHN